MDKSNNKYYVNTFGQLCYSNGIPVSQPVNNNNPVNSNYMFEPSAPPISSMNLENHALNDVFYYNNVNHQINYSNYQIDEKYLPSAPPEDLVILNNQQKINSISEKNIDKSKQENKSNNKNQNKEKCIVS